MKSDFWRGLNPAQAEAVRSINGPSLVIAGAGTGKTRVITFRIANMLREWIDPKSIVGLTFTNKAAREMRERVSDLVDPAKGKELFLGTFHSFCLRVLKSDIASLGFTSGFSIANQEDQSGVLKQAIGEMGLAKAGIDTEIFRSAIGHAKNELISCEAALANAGNTFDRDTARVYQRYQQILKFQNMVDFDDMLTLTADLWTRFPDILGKYQARHQYLLVDEFQDTNHVQFRLVKLLAGPRANVCAVGDDDQSIYGWRGAQVENILEFDRHFPGAKIIKLEQNYRSTNTILKAANAFMASKAKGHLKTLWSDRGEGELIRVVEAEDETAEARRVIDSVFEMRHKNPSLRFNDFAVLYRSNHMSRVLEREFLKERMPHRLAGSSFYDRREVRDAVAYLKILSNPREDQSLLRVLGVPPRGIGEKSVELLRSLQNTKFLPMSALLGHPDYLQGVLPKCASASKAFADCLGKWREALFTPGALALKTRSYFQEIGFLDGFQKLYKHIAEADNRRDNVIEFIESVAEFERDHPDGVLDGFLDSFTLADDNDKTKDSDSNGDAVSLMTVHASKGLEFPVVFLTGLEHKVFPHWRAVEEGNLEEERRLFYVAVTRAKDHLQISNVKVRKRLGETLFQEPSRFLDELPEELVDRGPQQKEAADEDMVKDAFASFYAQFEEGN